MNKLLYNRYYRLILRILLLILCIILTGCSTSSNTPTVSDRRVQQTSVNITNKCSTTDENGNNTGTISDELLGTGHEIDIPEAVGSKQVPGSVTVVQPKEGAEWLFSGTNPEGAAEPCKTVFDKWRANGGKWNDGLAAIANVPIVAIPERLAKDAVGDDIFNNKWKGVGVGCFIDIYYSDGHFVRILVGDTKNPSDSTAYMYDGKHWGHQCGNGVSMIEPWQSKDDYFDNKVPGNSGYHDDLSGTMTKWYVYENKVQDMDTANLTMSSNTSGKKSNNSNSSSTTNTSATDSGDDIDECDSDGNKTNASIGEGAEGAVEWAIRVANSKNVGYTQDEASQESETGRESIKKYDGSTKTVEQKRSSDCTAFVWYAWMIGGKNTKCEEVSPHWGPATGYFDSYYPKAGFEKHQLTDTSQLQAGDVLWRDGHAALYIGDGKIAQESWNENHDISGGQVGDQLQTSEDGEEDNIGECNITELSQVSLPFTYYWRYTGSSSSSS